MGMGSAPASSWTISTENLGKEIPKEWKQFMKTLEEAQIDLEDYARSLCFEWEPTDNEKMDKKIHDSYKKMQDAFKKKTKLRVYLSYVDPESGDRYDDVSGVVWELDGVEQLTPAGKKMGDKIQYSRWTIWG